MKIAVITNLYPPISRGGAEKVAQRIVGELVSRGHDVVVITSMPLSGRFCFSSEVKETIAETVYRFFPLNVYHILKDYSHIYPVRLIWHIIDLFSFSSPQRVAGILHSENPDFVLTHNLKGLGLRVPQVITKLGLPFIHTVHDIQLSVPSGLLMYGEKVNLFEKLFRRPYELAVRWAIGQPNLVISPSQFLADFYKNRDFFKQTAIKILPNPAPHLHLSLSKNKSAGPLRLLFAGQLCRHKGILDLLEAINLLDIPVELHVAGDGQLSSVVKEWSQKDSRVIFHGFVSTNCLEQLFNIVDVTVVPSRCYENSPTIIYESLQSGVPVIASNIGGVGELIQHGQNGYLFEPGNVQALVQIIQNFSKEINKFNSSSREISLAMDQHSLKNYVDQLEKLMKDILRHF